MIAIHEFRVDVDTTELLSLACNFAWWPLVVLLQKISLIFPIEHHYETDDVKLLTGIPELHTVNYECFYCEYLIHGCSIFAEL